METVFAGLRKIILTAASCSKPDQKTFSTLQGPLAKEVNEVVAFPEKNRKERVWYNHLMVISEGISSVGWIGVVSQARLDRRYFSCSLFSGTKTWPACRTGEGECRILWQ